MFSKSSILEIVTSVSLFLTITNLFFNKLFESFTSSFSSSAFTCFCPAETKTSQGAFCSICFCNFPELAKLTSTLTLFSFSNFRNNFF